MIITRILTSDRPGVRFQPGPGPGSFASSEPSFSSRMMYILGQILAGAGDPVDH